MKQLLCLLIAAALLFHSAPRTMAQLEPDGKETPKYAQWVHAAKQAASSKFPEAALVDFLYVGCMAPSSSLINHIYKFWMSKGDQGFGVYVTVTVRKDTHEIVQTSIERTDSIIPTYGKWRRLAIKSVQGKYPEATIMDYRPVDCKWISSNTASQTFTFWLEQNNQTILIKATLIYRIQSEVVVSVHFETIRNPN